ncbi:MAG: hypothetical protein RLZZ622_1124 [Planctomycetota bacterium]|jgi:hypothetical protein
MTAEQPAAGTLTMTGTTGCRLEEDVDGGLVLITADGLRHTGVLVVRAFPLSFPQGPVAILDAGGRELLWAESIDAFSPETRQLVANQLAAAEFLPRIEAIMSATRREPLVWETLTDRGRHRFQLAATEAVIRHPDGSATVTDTAGICYLVPAVRQLDRRSRRLLEQSG